MKKIFALLFLFFPYIIHCQQLEWIIFKNPQPSKSIFSTASSNPSIQLIDKNNSQLALASALQKIEENNSYGFISPYTNTIPDNFIVCLAKDLVGNIWAGTYLGGIAKYDGTNWKVYNISNSGLPSNTIYSIGVDKLGNKWIGTMAGVVKFDGFKWTLYNKLNSGLPGNIIYSIAIDENGNKWFGTSSGLAKYDDKKWIVYNNSNSKLPNNRVSTLSIDAKGNKWIGTFEGLVKIEKNNWKVYNTSNSGLPYNDIYSISFDDNNQPYILTWGGGLVKFDENKWTVYNNLNSKIPDDFVSSFITDKKKNKWIGTLNGLVKLTDKKWNIYKNNNSKLPDNMIYTLLLDNANNLWIGTQNGLAVYKEGGIANPTANVEQLNTTIDNSNVIINWKGKTAITNYGFEIERSYSNSKWETIGLVKRIEKGNDLAEYSFIDQEALEGKIFYRIKQIDNTGNYFYSNVIQTVLQKPYSVAYQIIKGNSKIKLALPQKNFVTIILQDLFGREIKKLVKREFSSGYHIININSGTLAKGFYICKMHTSQISLFKEVLYIK